MPGRSRGRPAPQEPAGGAYPGYPGYGGHPDDGYDPYDHPDDVPPPARNGGAAPARNGAPRPPAPPRGPGRRDDDDHEPLYARDHTPLGYDGGDPDDPQLLTHDGGADTRRNGKPARGRNGFDREGFDREGFDRHGFDREGFDREGFDAEGFDRDGFDLDGYDRDGYPADDLDEGYDDGYDEAGYDEYDDYEDDEDYDDDAYGVGDGPLAVPPPGSNGRPLGPADVEELDPSMTDALARVDLGSMQVPVPFGAEYTLEGAEGGRPQAVHLMLPEGRIAVSALAAPRSAGLWPELCDEIEESLRGGGARVRTAHGDWGRELHARTENAASVFIGADGPRWMVYGVATAAMDTVEALDVELRRVMRGIIVVRGKLPYPPRTVLPLERAEDRAEAESVDKPRTASITVNVPAARPEGDAAASGSGATTRTPAAADGPTTRTPAAGGARNGVAANGAARGGTGRNAVARDGAAPGGAPVPPPNGAARPGPARPATPQAPPAAADRTGAVPAPDRRRPGPPPARRPDVPEGPAPSERPAANGARRPAPARPAEAAPPPDQPRGPAGRPGVAPGGRREPVAEGPRGPEGTGSARAPRTAEETGVLRPRGAVAPGTPPAAGDAERTGAQRARRGEPTGSAPARTPGDTGRDARAGADRNRYEDTGAGRARRAEGTGGSRARRELDDAPARDGRQAPPTRMLPPVEAPAAGYAEETPVSGTASVRRDDLLWTPESADARDDRRPAAPARPPDRTEEEPPARRDPAVTSLPSFGPDAGTDRSARRPDPVAGSGVDPAVDPAVDAAADPGAWTPPSGISVSVSAGVLDDLGDDEVTPSGGSRSVNPLGPWETDAPAGRDRDEPPLWRDLVDRGRRPGSRIAIEDIPLSDVPLVEATLDSAPVAPPELPRRRPAAGSRRREAPATDGRGTRRRAPEEEVLSDWMSAEIAARPSGRHASPGHRDRPAGNGAADASVRSLSERRGTDRAAPGEDLFRSAEDEPGDARRGRRAEDRPERRRRGRTGTDGRGAGPDDDPMTLFRAPDDSGRHRR